MDNSVIAAITITGLKESFASETATLMKVIRDKFKKVVVYIDSDNCKMSESEKQLVREAIEGVSIAGIKHMNAVKKTLEMAEEAVKKLGLPQVTVRSFKIDHRDEKGKKRNEHSGDDGDDGWEIKKSS